MSTTEWEHHEKVTDNFLRAYNDLVKQIVELEKTNSPYAADKHVAIGSLIARYMNSQERFIEPDELLFLREEFQARCSQALVLRSLQLSGFADLALSLSATRNLQADIDRARKRLNEARNDDAAEADEDEDATTDPRVHTNGLYEFIPNEQIDVKMNELPGYEREYRQIFNAYYVINGSVSQNRQVNETVDSRRPRARAGANLILHGPPGTGKTTAARAIAAALGLNLAFVNAENLLSAYRSETEKNLRALYNKMRAIVRISGRNIVLLLDEVDGLVKNRSSGAAVTSGEYSLLTKFLTILEPNDGKDNYGVFSIFTTNRLSNLDDAFKRRCSTVFMGYVGSIDARLELFGKFFDDVLVAPGSYTYSEKIRLAKMCEFWVPNDFARVRRTIVDPRQLELYLKRKKLSFESLIDRAAAKTSVGEGNEGGGDSRAIHLELQPLSYTELLNVIEEKRYTPITPPERYNEYNEIGEN